MCQSACNCHDTRRSAAISCIRIAVFMPLPQRSPVACQAQTPVRSLMRQQIMPRDFMTKLATMTAALTTVAIVGWPVAVVGTALIIASTVMVIWVLSDSERTRRLVNVIRAMRSMRGLPCPGRRRRSRHRG
jgi:hypothetical protein